MKSASSDPPVGRQDDYKRGLNAEDATQKRRHYMHKMRKNKRLDKLWKGRQAPVARRPAISSHFSDEEMRSARMVIRADTPSDLEASLDFFVKRFIDRGTGTALIFCKEPVLIKAVLDAGFGPQSTRPARKSAVFIIHVLASVFTPITGGHGPKDSPSARLATGDVVRSLLRFALEDEEAEVRLAAALGLCDLFTLQTEKLLDHVIPCFRLWMEASAARPEHVNALHLYRSMYYAVHSGALADHVAMQITPLAVKGLRHADHLVVGSSLEVLIELSSRYPSTISGFTLADQRLTETLELLTQRPTEDQNGELTVIPELLCQLMMVLTSSNDETPCLAWVRLIVACAGYIGHPHDSVRSMYLHTLESIGCYMGADQTLQLVATGKLDFFLPALSDVSGSVRRAALAGVVSVLTQANALLQSDEHWASAKKLGQMFSIHIVCEALIAGFVGSTEPSIKGACIHGIAITLKFRPSLGQGYREHGITQDVLEEFLFYDWVKPETTAAKSANRVARTLYGINIL